MHFIIQERDLTMSHQSPIICLNSLSNSHNVFFDHCLLNFPNHLCKWVIPSEYYENTPMQYTAIFHGCKNVHFQMKFFNIFSYPQSMFWSKNKKNCIPCKPQFYYTKVGCKGVYITRTCFHDDVPSLKSLDHPTPMQYTVIFHG